MTLSSCACFFLKRILAILAAGVTLLAWEPLTPARGQCSPQEVTKLIASDGAPIDEFGFNVALSGDTAVIGAFIDDYSGLTDAGSAYVFIRSGALWIQQAKLIPSDAANNDNFGAGVAVEGDTAVVGSYTDDHVTGNDQGSAYVFIRSGTVWTQAAKLTASDATTDDIFGWSVAISGDTVLIGAYGDDTTAGTTAGSAYVFMKPPGGWTNMTESAKLTPSDAAQTDEFGYTVALSGDTAVVGAVLDNINGGPGGIFDGHGSAYVFVRSGTVWTQQAKLTASDAAGMDNFGVSIAVSGDTVMIGASRADTPGVANTGGAYVFVKPGGGWVNMTQTAKLLASDIAASDNFGASVSLSGDTAVVGARLDNTATGADAGSAYIFTKPASGWVNMTETVKFTASDGAASDQFGYAVAMSGDRVVIGAALEDNAGGSNAGSAYIFDLNCAAECCAGDFDNNNVVTNADIADFVAALLAGAPCPILSACCPADFNVDGTIDGRDVPGFLAKLFSGGVCP
jgi:hypothetical protein